MPISRLPKPLEFNWDLHNIDKNWHKHKVDHKECEQAFKNAPQAIFEDKVHSVLEKDTRYLALQMNTDTYLLPLLLDQTK